MKNLFFLSKILNFKNDSYFSNFNIKYDIFINYIYYFFYTK